jgi:hypothetical protein
MLKLAVEPKLPITKVHLLKGKLGNSAALVGAAYSAFKKINL